MRLLNTKTYRVTEFLRDIPLYAILSHRWQDQEVTFRDILDLYKARRLRGFRKIKRCCRIALEDGYEWVWIDTCCIDKTSSAEVSEAINSMYVWYRDADICYAYLEDVRISGNPDHDLSSFRSSEWFHRGWTLQELIAPRIVAFFAGDWSYIGRKNVLADTIQEVTNIDRAVLLGMRTEVCVAQRMSWAARRCTTREEDEAYSLMGLFEVHMPIIYGEGRKAFIRLQHEIMKTTNFDHSLFAWSGRGSGVLTDSPCSFMLRHIISIKPTEFAKRFRISHPDREHAVTSDGIRMQLPLRHNVGDSEERFLGALACLARRQGSENLSLLCLSLERVGENQYLRTGLVCLEPDDTEGFFAQNVSIRQHEDTAASMTRFIRPILAPKCSFCMNMRVLHDDGFAIQEVACTPGWFNNPQLESCGVVILFHETTRRRFAIVLGLTMTSPFDIDLWSNFVAEDESDMWDRSEDSSVAQNICKIYDHRRAATRFYGLPRLSKPFGPALRLDFTVTEVRYIRMLDSGHTIYDVNLSLVPDSQRVFISESPRENGSLFLHLDVEASSSVPRLRAAIFLDPLDIRLGDTDLQTLRDVITLLFAGQSTSPHRFFSGSVGDPPASLMNTGPYSNEEPSQSSVCFSGDSEKVVGRGSKRMRYFWSGLCR